MLTDIRSSSRLTAAEAGCLTDVQRGDIRAIAAAALGPSGLTKALRDDSGMEPAVRIYYHRLIPSLWRRTGLEAPQSLQEVPAVFLPRHPSGIYSQTVVPVCVSK